VSAAELERLFPEPSNAPLFFHCCRNRVLTFYTASIVVSKDDTPILLLPLFETHFDLSTFVEDAQEIAESGRPSLPVDFSTRILAVGLLWGME